jgi:hypothetical protein
LDEGKSSYRGRSHVPRAGQNEKSAEVIVVIGNEPPQTNQTSEASQGDEGPNIKVFQMQQGDFDQPCYKQNRVKEVKQEQDD